VPSVVPPLPVVVLASGRGNTFAALFAAQHDARLPIEIRALLSDRRTAPALEIAESRGIPAVALRPRDFPDRPTFDHALFARASAFEPALIVLAGYMRVIDAGVVAGWLGRMINLHPSLLPKYPGMDTYARVLESADATFGASVHYVTSQLDGGPVISQVVLPVMTGDTPDLLAARLRPAEQALLIRTVGLIAGGRVALGPDGIELDGRPLRVPLQMDPGGGFAGL
jgi:phosphoribosylglycinamide formyltransferase-1